MCRWTIGCTPPARGERLGIDGKAKTRVVCGLLLDDVGTRRPVVGRALRSSRRRWRLKTFAAGEDLVRQGERPATSTLVVAGITARYSTVEDGGRQITGLRHIAGDFVDLHSFPLQVMDHSVTAITACEVVAFPHLALKAITEGYPHLTRVLWLSLTLLDGAIYANGW